MKNPFRSRKRPQPGPTPYAIESFSQEGEDMILRRIFEERKHGFYIEVGAHHPQRFSNTYYFYRLGWRGLLVEPNPEMLPIFRQLRPEDIVLPLGVADAPGQLTYHFFDEPALNTFDKDLAQSRITETPYKLIKTSEIPVQRLETILAAHLLPGQGIDFLSVDVEGLDLAVLKSNDWTRYRPACVLAEALTNSMEEVLRSDLFQFMAGQGYRLLAKTFNTLIFQEGTAA